MADKKKTPAQQKAIKIAAQTRKEISEQSPPVEGEEGFIKNVYSEGEALAYMNERFAVVVNYGGKCLIFDAAASPGMMELRQVKEVRTELMHLLVESEDKRGNRSFPPILDWWLKNPRKRQYPTAKFFPTGDLGDEALNLWRGWYMKVPNFRGVNPYRLLKKSHGNKHKGFLDYVKDVLCDGDYPSYNYLMDWMARAVQLPHMPGESAIVATGVQGAGKTFFSEHLGALFGEYAMLFGEGDRITQKFNSLMSKCIFLGAEEAYFSGDRKAASVMKYLLTSSTRIYENKGVEAVSGRNCVHLVMTSNREFVAAIEPSDRRHLVLSVATHRVRDNDYFRGIAEDLASGGYDSLWTELMETDISKFYPGDIPMTNAKRRHICYSLESSLGFWYEIINYGQMSVQDNAKIYRYGGKTYGFQDDNASAEEDGVFSTNIRELFSGNISWRHIYHAYLQQERNRGHKHSTGPAEFRQHILRALPDKVKTEGGGGGAGIGGRITIPTQQECLDAFENKIITPYMKKGGADLNAA